MHGTADEFIPFQHTQRMYEELVRRDVPAGLALVEGGRHMFEMLGVPRDDARVWQSVLDGYEFLKQHVGLGSERQAG